jgi:hypothetical protein
MATAGPLTPSTASGAGWTNPSNIEGSSSYAEVDVAHGNDDVESPLIGTNFGFTIPAGSTINGIAISFTRKVSSTTTFTATTNSIQLLKAGSAAGTAKTPGNFWTASDVAETAGSTSDLWGTTWTLAQINASGFGFQMVAEGDNTVGSLDRVLSVNAYSITVTYTTASGLSLCQTSTFGF